MNITAYKITSSLKRQGWTNKQISDHYKSIKNEVKRLVDEAGDDTAFVMIPDLIAQQTPDPNPEPSPAPEPERDVQAEVSSKEMIVVSM